MISSLLAEIAGGDLDPDAYDKLPPSIRGLYTRKEWLWLSDAEKADLVTHECEPEVFVD